MKTKIFLATLIAFFAALITYMQDPFILAGGSDVNEVTISPDTVTQWLALFLFSILALIPVRLIPLEKRITPPLKAFLLFISFIFLLASGHTYRYSGHSHALVDSWYFIPLQTLEIDPNNFIAAARYRTDPIFVYVYVEDQMRQIILSGPGPFGIHQSKIVEHLKSFGFEPKS
jgi:hypothetical protein